MAEYQNLRKRIDAGDVIVLDGAVGTQLQDMGRAHGLCSLVRPSQRYPPL